MDAPSTRAITNTVGAWLAEESRNGLTIAGEAGYEHFPIVDTKPRLDAIRELNPDVAPRIEKRIKKARILPADTVARNWPEAKRRLLADQDHARIGSLRFAHQF